MKTLLLLTMTFSTLTFSALAQTNMESCSQAAKFNGNPGGGSFVPDACRDLAFESGVHSDSQKQIIFGKQNLLYIPKTETEFDLIAGTQTGLSNIEQIVHNPEEKRVYVLNYHEGAASILSFKTDAGGNVAPVRKLVGEEISKATGFTADYEGKKIYAYSDEGYWVKCFNLHADPDGRKPANSTKVLGRINLENSPRSLTLLGEDLLVHTVDEILIFEKNLSNSMNEAKSPKQVIHTGSLFEQAYELGTDQSKNALRLEGQEGVVVIYEKNENGYYERVD